MAGSTVGPESDAPMKCVSRPGKQGRASWVRAAAATAVLIVLVGATGGQAHAQRIASSGDSPRGVPTADGSLRILVSLEERMLWLVEGTDTLLSASVAVGRNETFRYGNRSWDWRTPAGERRVLAMRRNPVWSVPDWHYYERAWHEGLKLVKLLPGATHVLADGSRLEIRGSDVVRVLGDQFWVVPPGREIIIDGVLYVPPHGTNQRRVPEVLGTRALDLGEGYLIHGTNPHNQSSVGTPASHGCVRMHTADVERLFEMVRPGTPVTIY